MKRRPDPAGTDHPDRGPAQLEAPPAARIPALPAAIPEVAFGPRKIAGCRHRKSEGKLGGGVGQGIRSVGDRHTTGGTGLEVDVVVTDPVVGNHLQLRTRGVKHLAVDGEGQIGDQPLGPARRGQHLRPGRIESERGDIEPLFEQSETGRKKLPHHHHFRPLAHRLDATGPRVRDRG